MIILDVNQYVEITMSQYILMSNVKIKLIKLTLNANNVLIIVGKIVFIVMI